MSIRVGDVLAPVIPSPSVGTDHFIPGNIGGSFSVSGVDMCIVNLLRRAIIACVETAAFDTGVPPGGGGGGVRVLENTSVMHNEMLALRVSLVPLCLTPNELENFAPGDYQCTLAVRNNGNEVFDVRSGDSVLLTVLRPNIMCGGVGEAVNITVTARLGSGRDHARYSPVCSCYFRYKEPVLDDDSVPDKFDFFVESVNPSMSPYYLVFLGFRFLVRDIIDLSEDVRAERVSFEDSTVPGGARSILFPGLDHTLGNLIHGLAYDLWIRRGGKSRVSYVGYFKRHPLVDDITFKMQLARQDEAPTAYSDVLLEGLLYVRKHLESLTIEWIRFCGLKGMGLVAIEMFLTRSYAATVSGKENTK
eukprot:gene29181-biopygen33048